MPADLNISPHVEKIVESSEKDIDFILKNADYIGERNQWKVLAAMRKNRVSDAHFSCSTGYGYNDLGRETLEAVYADVFKAEAALVRPQLVSGTHALAVALFGNLRPGDTLLYVTGAPYDTLRPVIGIYEAEGSLKEYGISYLQADLTDDGGFDYAEIAKLLKGKFVKMAAVQRSKGYAWRKSLSVAEIGEVISFIKQISPDTICMVDNCYGEFAEEKEPVEVGADMAVGSLIKNPGGGLVPAGGYIVGTLPYVKAAAARLTAPGLGFEVGANFGLVSTFMQGLFLAPQVVANSVRGAVLAASVFEKQGFEVLPSPNEQRADIVQAVKLGSSEAVLAFCRGIQAAAPVDSFVVPEAAGMPGYKHQIVMAAGTFIQGASIELSADAPLIPPYIVYMQGGITRYHSKIGIMAALQELYNMDLL